MGGPQKSLLPSASLALMAGLLLCQFLSAQAAPDSSSPAAGGYFVAYRTPAHVRASGPEVFHGVADEVHDFLKSKNVVLVADPDRPSFQTAELFSLESLLKLAREAGASHLLYLTVDRPASKWVKITLQCYDLSGKLLWEEVTDSGSWTGSKSGLRKALEKLRQKLEPRLGGPGLPVAAPTHPPAETQEKAKSMASTLAQGGREEKRRP